jgi:hypothetical protein
VKVLEEALNVDFMPPLVDEKIDSSLRSITLWDIAYSIPYLVPN